MRNWIVAVLCVIGGALCGAEHVVFATLDDGTRLLGWTELSSTGPKGVAERLWQSVKRIDLAERRDPNLENDALVAIDNLHSADYATRTKAIEKIKALGRAAAEPLRRAVTSEDAEVSRLAKGLLVELGLEPSVETGAPSGDVIETRNGLKLVGACGFSEILLHTRYGTLKISDEVLRTLEFGSADADAFRKQLNAAPQAGTEFKLFHETTPLSKTALRWEPLQENSGQIELSLFYREFSTRCLTMDKVPETPRLPGAPLKWAEAREGDELTAAFLEKGVVVKTTNARQSVIVSRRNMPGYSGGLGALVNESDIDFTFGTLADSKRAGVFFAGMFISAGAPGTVGLAAFDASGRLLGQTFNQHEAVSDAQVRAAPAHPHFAEFLGLSSRVPIARLKLFRAGITRDPDDALAFDDFIFDRPVSSDARAGECRVRTIEGEQFSGEPLNAPAGYIALKTPWRGADNAPLRLEFARIGSYEPARPFHPPLADSPDAQNTVASRLMHRRALRMQATWPAHVTLHSGAQLRAHLLELDETSVTLALARGVEIKLPRTALREITFVHGADEKVPLSTQPPPSGKPLVLLKIKAAEGNPAAPQFPPEEHKDPARNPAQGTDRIDDADIAGIDPDSWMLKLKDENGNESEIGMPGVKALIFPAANAAPAPEAPGWTLTLSQGSSFDAELVSIETGVIKVKMAGGEVLLPPAVVASIVRK